MWKMQESDSETKRQPSADDLTEKEALDIVREIHEFDACEVCLGENGGTPGNENIATIDGVKKVLCDYCHVKLVIDRSMGS
jgi:hypothetical protein